MAGDPVPVDGVSRGVRFVLLRPREGGNVGAAARALKNFDHPDWAVVPGEPWDDEAARRMAVQSHDWLERMQRPASLDEAIADGGWVVGTSSRRRKGVRRLDPRAFAEEAVARLAAGPVVLVFGEERSGLSNEELDRCHDQTCLPTSEAQPSVNLAQAVLLYAYELRQAMARERPPPLLPAAASDAQLQGLRVGLERLLSEAGFLTHDPRPALQGLLAPLVRSRLTREEATLWQAALGSMRKALGRRGD